MSGGDSILGVPVEHIRTIYAHGRTFNITNVVPEVLDTGDEHVVQIYLHGAVHRFPLKAVQMVTQRPYDAPAAAKRGSTRRKGGDST